MEKEAFNDHASDNSDDEFIDLDAPMLNPFEKLELLSILGHEMEVAERDTGSGLKNLREEMNSGHGRTCTQSVSHFSYQLGEVIGIDKLKAGLGAVTEERKHVCSVCNKSYKKKNNLVSHMRKHTGEKPFRCNQCGRLFTERSNLKTHLRIHSGQKPYKCLYCASSFTTKGHLVEHKRVHTGERPYTCKECGKSFRRSTTHKIHLRVHTKERPFVCCYCSKSFTESGNLRIHIRIHTNEKPFECTLGSCKKTFRTKANLIEHLKTKRHNKDVEEVLGVKLAPGEKQTKTLLQRLLELTKITPIKATEE